MTKLAAILLITIAFVAFALANSHDVTLYYVVGEPIHIRLVFLLVVTFSAGAVSTLLYRLYNDVSERRHQARRRLAMRARAELEEDEL